MEIIKKIKSKEEIEKYKKELKEATVKLSGYEWVGDNDRIIVIKKKLYGRVYPVYEVHDLTQWYSPSFTEEISEVALCIDSLSKRQAMPFLKEVLKKNKKVAK
jgi:hypothetical protein